MKVFKKKPPGPAISRTEALDRVPVKSTQITEDRLETGVVVIQYPVTIRPFFASLVKRFGGQEARIQMKKIELDELGTEVWDLLDGRRSVRHLIKSFAGTHQLEPREAEVSVTQFIRELGRRGLVAMK